MSQLSLSAFPADLVRAVTKQKDDLLAAINAADYAKELQAAAATLALVSPVWHAVGYGYKAAECRDRIVGRAQEIIRTCDQLIAGVAATMRELRATHARKDAVEHFLLQYAS